MSEQAAKEYANGLRQLADWIEAHPDISLPNDELCCYGIADDREEAARVLSALGSCEKKYTDQLFKLNKNFGPLTLSFVFMRNSVCTRRVVGTKVIPETIIPAKEEQVIPERVEEIVEWDCAEPLLKKREAA